MYFHDPIEIGSWKYSSGVVLLFSLVAGHEPDETTTTEIFLV